MPVIQFSVNSIIFHLSWLLKSSLTLDSSLFLLEMIKHYTGGVYLRKFYLTFQRCINIFLPYHNWSNYKTELNSNNLEVRVIFASSLVFIKFIKQLLYVHYTYSTDFGDTRIRTKLRSLIGFLGKDDI